MDSPFHSIPKIGHCFYFVRYKWPQIHSAGAYCQSIQPIKRCVLKIPMTIAIQSAHCSLIGRYQAQWKTNQCCRPIYVTYISDSVINPENLTLAIRNLAEWTTNNCAHISAITLYNILEFSVKCQNARWVTHYFDTGSGGELRFEPDMDCYFDTGSGWVKDRTRYGLFRVDYWVKLRWWF